MVQVESHHAGPLPAPDTLKAYDEIVPGMAERLLVNFEKQVDHRIALERYVIQGDVRRSNLGLYAALIFGLAVLGVATILILNGHSDEGVKTIIGVFLTYGSAFLYSDVQRRRERARKR
jgi:uncharacterized membrane protein